MSTGVEVVILFQFLFVLNLSDKILYDITKNSNVAIVIRTYCNQTE